MDKYSIWGKYRDGYWFELGSNITSYRSDLETAKRIVDKKRKECPDSQFKIVETIQQDIY